MLFDGDGLDPAARLGFSFRKFQKQENHWMRRPLTIKFLRAMIDFILKKAWKRTLFGKRSRETPPWAASGVCRDRNSHRLGAARRYVGRDGISRYREHERHNVQKNFRWREGRMCARNPERVSCTISIKKLRRSFYPACTAKQILFCCASRVEPWSFTPHP